jgi:hypothetical protein
VDSTGFQACERNTCEGTYDVGIKYILAQDALPEPDISPEITRGTESQSNGAAAGQTATVFEK